MLHRSFLAWLSNPGSTTCLSISLAPSQEVILGRLRTRGDRRISIRSRSCPLPRGFLRILSRVARDGCALPRLTGHREVTDHLVMPEIAVAWTVMGWVLRVQTMPCLVGGQEEGARLG